jgi:hypothetical protein
MSGRGKLKEQLVNPAPSFDIWKHYIPERTKGLAQCPSNK